jgi:hypothetical protein
MSVPVFWSDLGVIRTVIVFKPDDEVIEQDAGIS